MANEQWNLTEEDFGPLWPYVQNEDITDINLNCDGKELWVVDINKGKYRVNDFTCKDDFASSFAVKVSNKESKQFNPMGPVLEAETANLRISCIHGSVTNTGISICIRKSPPVLRINTEKALETNFFSKKILALLSNCVRAKMNFVFCGEPGVGKTECAKFFTQFINPTDRVITIEDNYEFHYKEIYPERDCLEFKVKQDVFEYATSIKACLRQNPQWIMLSEARGSEVKYLLECWSTGVCGFTTLHTDDVRKIPDRIQNMLGDKTDAERLENDIFNFVNVGVLIRKKQNDNGEIYRYIDQVCFFTRENHKNRTVMVVEDGKMVKKKFVDDDGKETIALQPLPVDVMKKFVFADIENPLM